MEDNEQELIRSRFSSLINHIRCTAEFLMFFYEKKVLTFSEIQQIAGERVDTEKASKFLMLIQTRTNGFAVLKEGLLKFKQSGALNVLEGREELNSEPTLEEIQSRIENFSFEHPTASQKRNIAFEVLPPVLSFTGRTKELQQLHEMVLRSQGSERISVVSQVTSVSGLGGIGKTQLAKEYVRLYKLDFDGNVLWMNAESEESLYNAFKRLANGKLNLPIKDGNGLDVPAKCIAEAVYNYLDGMKALFVFDNAEKVPWLKQFMPQTGNTHSFFFLITSRDREWERGIETLSLDGLSEDEAVDLIQNGSGFNGDDPEEKKSVRKLAQTLQCFPLALQQAIAYIYEQRRTRSDYSAETYLKTYATKQQELLSYREENAIFVDIFTTTTATTWSMTFDKVGEEPNSGTLASLILNVVAYLGADNIRRDLFYRLQQKHHWLALKMFNFAYHFGVLNKRNHLLPMVSSIAEIDLVKQEQTNAAIRLLVKYSMLNGRDDQSLLSVHRLVQSVTRNQLAQDGMEKLYLEIALQLLQGSDDDEFPAENIGHALIVWRHAFAHNQIILRYAWQASRILRKMIEVEHHDEGLRFGNEVLVKFKEMLGEKHLNFLIIQRSTGLILDEQGYVDKAISVFQDILTKAKPAYGEDSEIFLVTKEDLGNSLRKSGKIQEAIKILREVLEKLKTISGDNHSSTLVTEQNYGLALMESGNLTEAENIFQRIIEIYIGRGEPISTKLLNFQFHLSINYSIKGDNEKAIEICSEVYAKLGLVWTENVDLFAAVCSKLGYFLNKVGKHEEALKILEGKIEEIKERLGSQHYWTLEIQQEIGRSYRGLGNLSKAHNIFQNLHHDFVSLSGEDSFNAMEEIAETTLSLLGEHSQALSEFQEIMPKIEAFCGKGDCNVINIKWKFALAIEGTAENLHIALDLLKQAKAGMIPVVGEDSPIVEKITNDIKRIEKKTESK